MKVLTKRQILLLHSALIRQSGGSDGIRDEGLLDSAVSTPFQTFADQELYPSLLEKAARLGFGLICNHPFIDGNKRIGTHAMLVFLDINQITLSYEDDDALHWMRLTPRLTIWMRQNEFRLSQPERLTVWTHMKNLCYLQFDIHGPFHGQFLRNTNELLRMLSDI